MTSKVKGQGHKFTSSVPGTSHLCLFLIRENAVPVSLEAGGSIPCRPNRVATLLDVKLSQLIGNDSGNMSLHSPGGSICNGARGEVSTCYCCSMVLL